MNLYIVTHWSAKPQSDWVWRAFVVAEDPAQALGAATAKNAYEVAGQLHVSQVSDAEFIRAVQS